MAKKITDLVVKAIPAETDILTGVDLTELETRNQNFQTTVSGLTERLKDNFMIIPVGGYGSLFYFDGTDYVAIPIGEEDRVLKSDGLKPVWSTAGDEGVTSVAAGNGMNFSEITMTGSVTLGTPTTLTGSTTNAVTLNSHTHELTITTDDIPGLATVATSGSYNDLSDQPTIINDKNFEQSFLSTDNITVNHNLNKYPSVLVIDTAGYEIVCSVQHANKNTCIVTLNNNETGIITCN